MRDKAKLSEETRDGSHEKLYKNWKPDFSQSVDVLTVDPDLIWQKFGTFGRYQLINLTMVSAPSMVYSALMMVISLLVEEVDDFTCVVSPEYSSKYTVLDRCTVRHVGSGRNSSCLDLLGNVTTFDYGESKGNMLTSEFNLVCEQSDSKEGAEVAFLFGSMIGSALLSWVSDYLGRRKSFLLSLSISVALNCATVLAPSYFFFMALRLLAGIGMGGNLSTSYIMASEVVAPTMREYTPFVATFFWVFGWMLSGIARLYISSWRWVYFACSAPGLLIVLFYFKHFPESLHWQVSKGKKEAIALHIQKATRINRMQINLRECLTEPSSDAVSTGGGAESEKPKSSSFWRKLKIFCLFVLSSLLMFVMNLTYWALSLLSTELSPHRMTGFFMSGLVEIPSAILAVIFLKMMKRCSVSFWMFVLTSISLAVSVLLPSYLNDDWASTISFWGPLFAKMFNSVVWSVLPLAMSEMTPTTIRNTFNGLVSFLGEWGSVAAPLLKTLNRFGPNTASILIAALTFICGFGVLTMPETKGAHLPSDLAAFDEGPFLRKIERTFSSKKRLEDLAEKDEEETVNVQ